MLKRKDKHKIEVSHNPKSQCVKSAIFHIQTRQRKTLNLKKLFSIISLTLFSTVAICQEEEVLTVATVPNDIESKVIQTLDSKKVNSEADTNVLEAEID